LGKQFVDSAEFTFTVNPFPEKLLAATMPSSFLSKTPVKSHVRQNAHPASREIFTHYA
jgi:hypothetical protein